MEKLQKSYFQMIKFGLQSVHFDASNLVLKGSDYNSSITAIPETMYNQDLKNWMAMIHLVYELIPKEAPTQENRPSMAFKISVFSVFSMEGDDCEKDKSQLEQLLKLNGMISTISALRSLLIVLSMQLGISPPIIFPNIDLRVFEWNTETGK